MSAAQRPEDKAATGHETQLVGVRVGKQLIGLPIEAVRDVFSIEAMTPVPRAGDAVAGLVNLRGHIVTILDLAQLLTGRSSRDRAAHQPMAVGVEWHNEVFGLLVDEIGDVIAIPASASEHLPANIGETWARVSRRVHKLDTELMIELDLAALLDSFVLAAA